MFEKNPLFSSSILRKPRAPKSSLRLKKKAPTNCMIDSNKKMRI